MVERVDDDRLRRRQPDRAEQTAFEIRANGKDRVEQQQQAAAAGQIFGQQVCFPRGKGGAWTDLGDDRAIGRDGTCRRGHDAARLVADLHERELQAVEVRRLGNQHVAGAGHIMALQGLDMTVVKMRLRRAEGLAMAGDEAHGLDPLLERAQRRIGKARDVGVILDHDPAATDLE